MDLEVHEFFSSIENGTQSTAVDREALLSTVLKTDFQLATVQSTLDE